MRSYSLQTIAVLGVLLQGRAVYGEPAAGTIKGHVSFKGLRPGVRPLEIKVDANFCGARQNILSEELLVSEQGDLANVAVFLVDPPKGMTQRPGAGRIAALKQDNCVFSPHVQTVSIGASLRIGNSDPVIHNVHATMDEHTVFNVAMPLKDVEMKRELAETGIVSLRCDSGHTWMKAFIVVFDHPFHATSDRAGRFEIKDVPPGRYTIRAWHEKLGITEAEVEVTGAGETALEIAFKDLGLVEQWDNGPSSADPGIYARLEKDETEPSREAARAQHRADIAQRGRPIYLRHCAACHGDKGNGAGEQAFFLSARPRAFTRGEFKFRTTPSGSLARIDDLVRTIAFGLRGTDMPGWSRTLSRDDIHLLAEYVTTFSPRYQNEDPPPPLSMLPEPAVDAASIARGKALYKKLQCAQCHGETGHGDGVSNAVADDLAQAPSLASGRFKGGQGPAAIFRATLTGLSGSSMPSFRDVVSQSELWDLAHYVDSLHERSKSLLDWLFRDPAGRRPLP